MIEKAILCVDDEVDVLDSVCILLLEEFGDNYEIEKAENSQDALEVIDELALDGIRLIIIVSDWLMPGMKGDDFLIRVHKKYPEIIKIMLSGQVDEKAVENARKHANLFKYIVKPWNKEELVAAIKAGLKKL